VNQSVKWIVSSRSSTIFPLETYIHLSDLATRSRREPSEKPYSELLGARMSIHFLSIGWTKNHHKPFPIPSAAILRAHWKNHLWGIFSFWGVTRI